MSRRADVTCGNHFANGRWKNRAFAGNACPFLRTLFVRHANRNNQCDISFSQPPACSWPERHSSAPLVPPNYPRGAAHNIVLVHGAFVDQTSWQPVADILTKKGYRVTLVENPLTSLAADVDATKQALAKQDGRTVLVGHSWGGVVITQAGNDPKVASLVYVSAFAPEVGESLASLAKAGPPTEGGNAIHPDAKGNLYIDPKVFPSAVAADLPPEIATHLANSQLPLNHVAFEAPVDVAAWHDKPTFYVISTKDKVLAPEAQKSFAARIKAQTTEVAGSHASLVVHAKQVAEVIEKAALAK
ncbi:pimeloyl-ACP methyl ester carboxylesterase [Bradyrhizobium sp. LM6.11]